MLTFVDRKHLCCNGRKGCKISMFTFGDRKNLSCSGWKVCMWEIS